MSSLLPQTVLITGATGAIGRALDGGASVYWVCPLVAESETVDLAAAEDRAERDVVGHPIIIAAACA